MLWAKQVYDSHRYKQYHLALYNHLLYTSSTYYITLHTYALHKELLYTGSATDPLKVMGYIKGSPCHTQNGLHECLEVILAQVVM